MVGKRRAGRPAAGRDYVPRACRGLPGPAGACRGLPGPTQHGWSTVMCVGQTRVELAYWQRTRRTPELNEMGSGVCV